MLKKKLKKKQSKSLSEALSGPKPLWMEAVRSGRLACDPRQICALDALQALYEQIQTPRNFWHRFTHTHQTIKGVYLYGKPGRGKSMMMDMLVRALSDHSIQRKHFHEFMGETHRRLNALRQEKRKTANPLARVARQLSEQTQCLCLDEFSVSNIADAMILAKLFSCLFRRGVILVTTSNTAPNALYADGLKRENFLPFIQNLQESVRIIHLDSPSDYRRSETERFRNWFSPLGDRAQRELQEAFRAMLPVPEENICLRFGSRKIRNQSGGSGILWIPFQTLCGLPLGVSDYLTLAERFHTVFLTEVPIFTDTEREQALRFQALIDVFYDRRIRLFASAAEHPESLWGREVAAQFARTLSRLEEMRSLKWFAESAQAAA